MSIKISCIQELSKIPYLADSPLLIFVLSVICLSASVWFGNTALAKYRTTDTETSSDLGIIQTATLTLLALIIGFTFSMAIARYDLRQTYEEAEANAIGTEFLRADLLPAKDAEKVKDLLNQYVDQRILFYLRQDQESIRQITRQTLELENSLWNAVLTPANSHSSPTVALAVAGMNDVINSQSYTQAAWWNRIPRPAWWLMAAIAVGANLLIGFGARNFKPNIGLFMIFPIMISIAFFLIADIDSPRGGVIKIEARNLMDLKRNIAPKNQAAPITSDLK